MPVLHGTAGLDVNQIVDHYTTIIQALDEPPIIMGHSFGGLFTQILVDRGLGSAGVAISSAPVKGIVTEGPTRAARTWLCPLLSALRSLCSQRSS